MNVRLRYTAAAAGVVAALCLAPVLTRAQNAAPATQAPPAQTPLPWAYPLNAPAPPAPPNTDPTLHHVPNSSKAFTTAQVTDGFNPPDWHPEGHPAMPEIVGHGRKQDVRACGYCHLPNAQGRPENASLAGLPAAYIVQQVNEMKSDARKSSEPNMGPPANMLKLAKASNDEEVKIAADYFSKLKYKPWIRVVEAKMVPKTKAQTGMLVEIEGGGMEPIGQRIIETAEKLEQTELRDDASPFVAYVPPGSIKKGETLATKGAGKTVQCAICHGEGLKGLGNVPFLAGRSPSYIARQLYDIKSGNRKGGYAILMKQVVDKLSNDDILAISAYTASLKP